MKGLSKLSVVWMWFRHSYSAEHTAHQHARDCFSTVRVG